MSAAQPPLGIGHGALMDLYADLVFPFSICAENQLSRFATRTESRRSSKTDYVLLHKKRAACRRKAYLH